MWAIGESHLDIGRRYEPTGRPFAWNVPSVECVACADGLSHDGYERYLPAAHYREIAADFLRLGDDADVLSFVRSWGLVRLHRLNDRPQEGPPMMAEWVRALNTITSQAKWTTADHDGRADRIDEVLEWAERARRLHGTAYGFDDAARNRGLLEVTGVIGTMPLRWASRVALATGLVPTSLVHYVFFALRGLYSGHGALVCAEALVGACQNTLPPYAGRGRPRFYCSDRCASRARDRKRRVRLQA